MLPGMESGPEALTKPELCVDPSTQGQVKGGKNQQSLNPTQSRAPRVFTLAEGVADDDPRPPETPPGAM